MKPSSEPDMQSSWSTWASFIRQHRLEGLVTWLLESAGPLNVIGAQALIFGAPLLQPALNPVQIESITRLLEDPSEGRDFISFLKEKGSA